NQVETLARTIHKRYRELFGEKVVIEENEYPGEYVVEIAKALKSHYGDAWLKKDESEWLMPLVKFGVNYNLALIKRSLLNIDIEIESWFKEHWLEEEHSLERLLALYEERNMLYEAEVAHGTKDKIRREESKAAKYSHMQEGGFFLKTSLFGDDEDRIVKRKDGRFVYLTADLAYHHKKYHRGFDSLINVFGADHSGHIGRIRAGMEALGHDSKKLQFAVVQMVRLLRNGKEVRFSKRAGEVVGLDDLTEEVGKDVARFVFLMRSPNSQFDLDLDILTKESQDNPVFYVQYGHARMATILKKAEEEKGLKVSAGDFGLAEQKALVLPEERELILKMTDLPEIIVEAATALEPHRVIFYCHELVKSFHGYFTKYRHSEKIISDDAQKTKARLFLVFALKETIYNALSFLGLKAPDYMKFADEAPN
ncbi:MAG TPA: arginine--tRNA ligase, partial [Myxococcota bacterium]|nr:arginine--tRNA ligase [Myxococcota bacterium]